MAAPLIMAAGMAGLGYLQAKEKQKQEKEAMLANAEQIRYSPWTGMRSQVSGATAVNPLMGAAQGALGGGLMGAQISGAMGGGQSQALSDLALQKQYKDVHGSLPDENALASLRPQQKKWHQF